MSRKHMWVAAILYALIVSMFAIAFSCDETPRGSVIPSYHGRVTPRVVVR